MALSDTAALVASLELQDKFSATASKFDRTVGGMERQVSTLGRVGGQLSSGIGTAVGNLQRLALVGVGVIGANVAAGIQSLVRLEEVTVATAAVIESTGGKAGVTAEQVRALAEEFESLNATMDDKVIQSAENVLLTFTAIGEEAFPLALEAALNMNQALGGGEEGLQSTIIQVGKALQDPIKGITALRKVGVSFSTAQQDTIKALVEENKLFEAQQLILNELAVEFGGQFAAAGDTAAGRFAKFKDAVEDAQIALASAFLPVLEKVGDKLTTLLADPATTEAITEVGENLAGAFDAVVDIAGNLPWESIGAAFELMGTGAKALLTAFTELPPWVQTAVLTGWGLNKLTGGMLGTIVSTLASGLIKGILGINAGVVNINAATVNGGAPGTGGGGKGGNPFGILTTLLGAAGLGLALGELTGGGQGPVPEVEAPAIVEALNRGLTVQEATWGRTRESILQVLNDPALRSQITEAQADKLSEQIGDVADGVANIPEKGERSARLLEARQTAEIRANLLKVKDAQVLSSAQVERRVQDVRTSLDAKKLSTTVNFLPGSIQSNVSITDITRRLVSQRISIGSAQGGITVE